MMNLTGVKNIVFDLGGVIITLSRDEAVRRFKSIGLERAEELLDPYHQKGVFLELEEGRISEQAFFDAIRTEAGKFIPDEEIRWGWMGFIVDCPDYKLKMLEDLRKDYKLYLLSNTNPVIMSWAMSSDFSKDSKSLDEFFDKTYLSYQMGMTKPNPKIFHDMIEDSGMLPGETLFIDDGGDNVRIGNELGFKTFQPKNGEDFRYIFGMNN